MGLLDKGSLTKVQPENLRRRLQLCLCDDRRRKNEFRHEKYDLSDILDSRLKASNHYFIASVYSGIIISTFSRGRKGRRAVVEQ
jgi:hypothetical protein